MVLPIKKLLYISLKAAPALNFSESSPETLCSKGFQEKQSSQAAISQNQLYPLKCSTHAAFSF